MPQQMGFLRCRHKKVSTGITTTHYGNLVDDGERWYLAMLAFSCNTTDNADVVVSIDGHGYDHVISVQGNMQHAAWYAIQPQLWLEAGERLKFDWNDIVNGEVVQIHVTGHIQYLTAKQED